jgi:hypothetical protein
VPATPGSRSGWPDPRVGGDDGVHPAASAVRTPRQLPASTPSTITRADQSGSSVLSPIAGVSTIATSPRRGRRRGDLGETRPSWPRPFRAGDGADRGLRGIGRPVDRGDERGPNPDRHPGAGTRERRRRSSGPSPALRAGRGPDRGPARRFVRLVIGPAGGRRRCLSSADHAGATPTDSSTPLGPGRERLRGEPAPGASASAASRSTGSSRRVRGQEDRGLVGRHRGAASSRWAGSGGAHRSPGRRGFGGGSRTSRSTGDAPNLTAVRPARRQRSSERVVGQPGSSALRLEARTRRPREICARSGKGERCRSGGGDGAGPPPRPVLEPSRSRAEGRMLGEAVWRPPSVGSRVSPSTSTPRRLVPADPAAVPVEDEVGRAPDVARHAPWIIRPRRRPVDQARSEPLEAPAVAAVDELISNRTVHACHDRREPPLRRGTYRRP